MLKIMQPRVTLFAGNFFIVIASTMISYTLFAYLSTFIPTAQVGFVLAAASAIALVTFFFLPRVVAHYGAQQTALWFSFAEIFLLFGSAAVSRSIVSAVLVVCAASIIPLILYELDLLLEATFHGEEAAGRARTFFLTGGNLGAITAPLLIGVLLANADRYAFVFFAAASCFALFVVLFSGRRLPHGASPHVSHITHSLKRLVRDRDLAAVTVGHLVLYFFYVWAPLYIPVYLHSVLGIPWVTLGWAFSVMLLPFILIEYPIGWISDNILGDKEFMFAGFCIAGASLASIGLFTQETPFAFILVALIMTRIGAALIESTTEDHFFRRVSKRDLVSVSVFRGVWPLATTFAPLLGGIFLLWVGYQGFFFITGGIVFVVGIIATLLIRDFR